MGNGSIVLVMGFIVLFGIVNTNFSSRNVETVQNVAGYAAYSIARDIANSAITITLRKIDTTSVLPSRFVVTGNVHDGSYRVDARTNGDTLWLLARGRMMDSVYTIDATFLRYPKPWPELAFGTALGLLPRPCGFLMQGLSARIDGRDHDSLGNLLPLPRADVPGVTVKHEDDSMTVYNNTQAPDTMLNGSQKIAVDPSMSIPPTFIQEVIANADYKYETPINRDLNVTSTTWGSPDNPVIVYMDARDTNKVKISGNCVGWGILLVKGTLELAGGVTWHGLVVGHSTTVIDMKTSGGNATVIGSFLFDGAPTSSFIMKGTGRFLFSKATLDKSKNVNKLLAYTILDWYE